MKDLNSMTDSYAICYMGSPSLKNVKDVMDDSLFDNMITSGSKAFGVMAVTASKFLNAYLSYEGSDSYVLKLKKATVKLRLSHSNGNINFTKSSHKGYGRTFIESEFIDSLKTCDGVLIIDTGSYTNQTPILNLYGIDSASILDMHKHKVLRNGMLPRKNFDHFKEPISVQ